jgi:hypothetical protein
MLAGKACLPAIFLLDGFGSALDAVFGVDVDLDEVDGAGQVALFQVFHGG